MKPQKPNTDNKVLIPLFEVKVPAGFPSPADNYIEGRVDINNIVIKNEAATFYMQVEGHSMIDFNIYDGDIIVVDRSIEARHGKTVVAVIDNEFTIKNLFCQNGVIKLVAGNSDYQDIVLKEEQELNIWGVVSYVIHKV